MSMKFKLIIFLFHLLLFSNCQPAQPQNQLPQHDPASQTEHDESTVITQSFPSESLSSQDGNPQANPVTQNSEINSTAQQAPVKTQTSADDYEQLPVNLDEKDSEQNSIQKNGTLAQTLPNPSTISTPPHIPYKGQQSFTYADDVSTVPNPSRISEGQNNKEENITTTEKPSNIFQPNNHTETEIQQFKPQDIEQIQPHQNNSNPNPTPTANHIQKPETPSQVPIENNNSTQSPQNQTTPQNNQTTPQNNQTTPQNNQTIPQDNQTTPQNNQTTPQNNQTIPQDNQTHTSENPQSQQQTKPLNQSELQQKIKELNTKLIEMENNNNLLTGQKSQHQNQILILKKQNSQLKTDLQQTKTQINQLQTQFQARLATAQIKNTNLTADHTKITADLAKITADLTKMTSENSQLNQQNSKLTEENAKLTQQNSKLKNSISHPSQTNLTSIPANPPIQSNPQPTEVLLKLEQQKSMLQKEEKQLNVITQTINSLRVQSDTSHQIPSPSSLPQDTTSVDKTLNEVKTAVSQLSTNSNTLQSSSLQQQSLLNQLLQQVKSIKSGHLASNTTSQPSNSQPQKVEQGSIPTGVQRVEAGYRVDVVVNWMSIYIAMGLIGVKLCKKCKGKKGGKAEDQKQLKTPKSMESRTSEEQFSEWQG